MKCGKGHIPKKMVVRGRDCLKKWDKIFQVELIGPV